MHSPNSKVLFELVQRGDEQALKQLFFRYYAELCNSIRRYVSDADTAEDLVQQVFIRLWEKREQLDIEHNVGGYLQRMAIREALMYLRRRNLLEFTAEAPLQTPADTETGEQQLLYSELAETISKAIERLPAACRTVFQLSRFESLSYREIAQELGISIKTVENQMGKALQRLREVLEKRNE